MISPAIRAFESGYCVALVVLRLRLAIPPGLALPPEPEPPPTAPPKRKRKYKKKTPEPPPEPPPKPIKLGRMVSAKYAIAFTAGAIAMSQVSGQGWEPLLEDFAGPYIANAVQNIKTEDGQPALFLIAKQLVNVCWLEIQSLSDAAIKHPFLIDHQVVNSEALARANHQNYWDIDIWQAMQQAGLKPKGQRPSKNTIKKQSRKKMKPSQIAIHEASHAIACAATSEDFLWASIRPQTTSAGSISFFHEPKATNPMQAGRLVTVALAGVIGEAEVSGAHWKDLALETGQADMVWAAGVLGSAPAIVELAGPARMLLRENWQAVERVACKLEEKSFLLAPEIAEIAGPLKVPEHFDNFIWLALMTGGADPGCEMPYMAEKKAQQEEPPQPKAQRKPKKKQHVGAFAKAAASAGHDLDLMPGGRVRGAVAVAAQRAWN